MKLFLILVSLISFGRCGENSVTINVKNVVNTISDKFVSYEFDFHNLMGLFLEEKSLDHLSLVSPAYIRLRGLTSYLKNGPVKEFNETAVASLFKSLNFFQISPVIVIDYNTVSFEPISLLHDMKHVRNLKIYDCIWQLGNNSEILFDSVSLKKYSDDLKTVKILCESVNKEHHLKWDVAADSSLLKNHVEKLPFEVVGYDLMKLSPMEIVSKSNSIAFKSQEPTWITVESSSDSSYPKMNSTNAVTCDHDCLTNGLLHAQIMGDAARKGFDVVFFDDDVSQLLKKSSSFAQAVSVLHKKLIGSKVFNVRVTKSSADGKLTNLYSYCSKKTNGAITLMGINFSNMRAKFNVKVSSPMDPNAIIEQYLLSASDNNVLLNNEKFNYEATPSYKFKKLSKLSIPLVLPPFSMAFWTIKNAKINECLSLVDKSKNEIILSPVSSSTDQLLKKLVANELDGKRSNELVKKSRGKRQLGGTQFLPKFDFELPFKFPNLMASASSPKSVKESFFSKNTDVYRVAPVDANPLQASENPSLPKGDVYLLINDGKGLVNSDTDYIIDDNDQPKRRKINRKKSGGNKIIYKETTEAHDDYYIPHDYIDSAQKTTKRTPKKSSKSEKPKEIGELFEAERPTVFVKGRTNDQANSQSANVELTTVIKELEPTYRQSKTALQAARRKWDKQQIMELLKDATLEDVDRAQLSELDDFEVIDMTEADEARNYEEYEEDEDGFFDDQMHHVRTRRNVDFARNEIPKHGSHHVIDEDEDSIESLMDDVHLFLPPKQEAGETKVRETSSPAVPNTTETPIPIQAINFFSKSLNEAVNVAHKTFVGWWYVFNPTETY